MMNRLRSSKAWRIFDRVGAVLLLLALAPVAAFAAIPVGPFEITPEVIVEERYDSNIFLERTDKTSDFITYGSFNLRAALPINLTRGRRILPFVSYFAEAAAFASHGSENFQNQGISGGIDLDLPLLRPDERFTANLSNRFRSVTEVASSALQSDVGPRTRRDENTLSADIGYFLTRRDEVHAFYNRLDVNQKQVAEFLDRNENTVGLTYFRRISPVLSGLAEYDYKFVDFTNLGPGERDFSSTGHIFAIGIRGDPTAQLSGSLKVGVEFRNFDTQSDITKPFATAALGYQITPRLLASLLLNRSVQESTNQDFVSFDQNLLRLRFTQQFTAKISGFLEGAYELDEFKDRVTAGDPARRFDHLYEFEGGGEYVFARWLRTGLSYLFRTKNSNVDILDYVDHRVVLRMTASF